MAQMALLKNLYEDKKKLQGFKSTKQFKDQADSTTEWKQQDNCWISTFLLKLIIYIEGKYKNTLVKVEYLHNPLGSNITLSLLLNSAELTVSMADSTPFSTDSPFLIVKVQSA